MLRCETTHFGTLEYSTASTVQFDEGIPGFEAERRFVVVQRPDHHPLVFLQSIETPALCFPALPAQVVDPQYQLRLNDADLLILGLHNMDGIAEKTLCLALIAIHENDPTANLLAPVVINLSTRAAVQCVDPEMRYSHRTPLPVAFEAAAS
jgi:flagellar assembly factor FliW